MIDTQSISSQQIPTGKNPAICLCRVFSMFLIILCHIIDLYPFIPGSQFLPQLLNVGLYTFLGISGFLYSRKSVSRFSSWFIQRLRKIAAPAVVLSATVFLVVGLTQKTLDWLSALVYLCNLQGIAFFLPRSWIFFREQEALAHLWFITVILLCYCLIPLLQKARTRFPSGPICLVLFALFTVSAYLLGVFTGVQVFYFLTFSAGYLFGWFGPDYFIRPLGFSAAAVYTFFMQVLRLWLRSFCDGTPWYESFVGASHMALGLWLLLCFFLLSKLLPEVTQRMAQSRLIRWLEDTSLYVYMTHQLFVVTTLCPYRYTENLLLATLLFFIFSFASALLLKWFSSKLFRIKAP